MSCGAAVFYLAVAARHFGLVPRISILPNLDQPDLIAYLRVDCMAVPSPETERLFQMIMHRHTQRSPFRPGVLHEPTARNLERAARLEGARLALVRSPLEQARVKEVVARARNKRYALGTNGKIVARPALRECAAIGLLCGTRDAAYDHVTGGMALARVLLSATSFGIYASFVNDPLDDPESRRDLLPFCDAPGSPSTPLAVLQLGYGGPERPSVRRPVHEVTRTAA
jgi:hypothetical protein